MTQYRHDEWCATKIGPLSDGTKAECDCYVRLLVGKDNEIDDLHNVIEDYRERIETFENELLHRAEFNEEDQPTNWCASVLRHTGLLVRESDVA